MSDLFKGITFPWQEVTPADDAIVRKAILPDRRLTGCELSYSGYTLTMTAGVLIVCGRQFRHTAAQNWAVTGAASGYARLLLTIDVTKASTEDAFEQITASIEYATAADGFPDLRQDDINNAGTIYQTSICVVALGPGGITGFTGQILPGDNVFYPGRPVSMGGYRVTGVGAPEADGDAVNLGYANRHYRKSDWMPSASEIGAAPSGYGLGGNGEPKNWSEIDNLIANGKYKISNINQTINGIGVASASLDVIYFGGSYGKQILRTVETASGSGASYTLERSRGYAGWAPWECDNPPFALGVEYRTTERLEGKPVYKKLINMGILASANGVVSVPHGISGATYIIGCRGIATQSGTQHGYEMASNDIQVEGGYVNWYDRNSTSSYYGYALISYLKN